MIPMQPQQQQQNPMASLMTMLGGNLMGGQQALSDVAQAQPQEFDIPQNYKEAQDAVDAHLNQEDAVENERTAARSKMESENAMLKDKLLSKPNYDDIIKKKFGGSIPKKILSGFAEFMSGLGGVQSPMNTEYKRQFEQNEAMRRSLHEILGINKAQMADLTAQDRVEQQGRQAQLRADLAGRGLDIKELSDENLNTYRDKIAGIKDAQQKAQATEIVAKNLLNQARAKHLMEPKTYKTEFEYLQNLFNEGKIPQEVWDVVQKKKLNKELDMTQRGLQPGQYEETTKYGTQTIRQRKFGTPPVQNGGPNTSGGGGGYVP